MNTMTKLDNKKAVLSEELFSKTAGSAEEE